MAKNPSIQGENRRALHEYRGAYTDLRDLIQLRYAGREITELNDDRTTNPLAGLLTSKFQGRGIDFSEVRVYQPGDDVRTIDWRVTARTQTAHTKLFQEEKERPVLILADQSTSMYFGSQVTFKSVLAARTAALIGWTMLERGDRVGGIVFSEHGHREVRPRRNKHALLRLLNELNDFNHALSKNTATQAVTRSQNYPPILLPMSDWLQNMAASFLLLVTLPTTTRPQGSISNHSHGITMSLASIFRTP